MDTLALNMRCSYLPSLFSLRMSEVLMTRLTLKLFVVLVVLGGLNVAPESSQAAVLDYAGTHFDIGGTFFPGGAPPYVVVPWRSEISAKPMDIDGNNVYGSAGYALFATQFNWPNQGCCGSSVPVDSATYPNLIDLPSFISDSQFLVSNKVGGWGYALIDDPTLVNGYRDYNWGDTQDPPVDPPNSQSPYVKMGIIEGIDTLGNNPRDVPAGRWAFEIGANPPLIIRVGVMNDGLDAGQWTANEVLLAEFDGTDFSNAVSSGTVARNRYVDIHFFDIVGAQEGDQFAVLARASGDGWGGISGVTFDYIPEPSSTALVLIGMLATGSFWRTSARS